MDIKQLDVPIKDFDTVGYDEVECIPKEVVVSKIEVAQELPAQTIADQIDLYAATGNQLLKYFLFRFQEVHGYEYKVDSWPKEIKTLNAFKDRYGVDAGPMIKILFDKHNGKLDATNGVITTTAFSKGAKWIQDMLYFDVKEENKKQSVDNSTEGLMSANDFIRAFRMA